LVLGLGVHGFVRQPFGNRLVETELGLGALLDHVGVDGLVLSRNLLPKAERPLVANGWKLVQEGRTELLFERSPLGPRDVRLAPITASFAQEGHAERYILARKAGAFPYILTGIGMASSPPRERCQSARLEYPRRDRNRSSVTVDASS